MTILFVMPACLFSTMMLIPANVLAGTGQDAHAMLSRLHKAGVDKILPEEVKSASETLASADNYYSSNQQLLAEKYYLLALQKARIIVASVSGGVPELPQSTEVKPIIKPSVLSSSSPLIPDSAQSPAPSPAVENPSAPAPVLEKSSDVITGGTGDEDTSEELNDGIVSDKIVGSVGVYTVVKGDSMALVSAKLGVSRDHLAKENKLASNRASLKVGQKLRYNNRKIIPQKVNNGIIINVPDRTLYFFRQGKLAISLPVALGVPVTNEKYDWRTPLGKFKITAKMKDPTWIVPPSIQSEMEENGKEVITSVPPGPENPLGKFAMKTSLPGILIHSTIKPGSIYGFASHGCIRVYPDKMEELFNAVKVSTPGEVIYRPVKLAVTEDGRVLLEAHKDVYDKNVEISREARAMIQKQKLGTRVDWKKVENVIRQKSGIAEIVSPD